ncbi:MAG: alginate lyase family protein [Methylacidiphilales bacterium]|nr:alginate lyase family protein [Candidatus Methylacidiphilales bacterium]
MKQSNLILPAMTWKQRIAALIPCLPYLGKRITRLLVLLMLVFCGWSYPAAAQEAVTTTNAPTETTENAPATSGATTPPASQVPQPEPLNLPPIPEKFVHPGLLNNMEELQSIKKKIAAGEEPWKTAFEAMKNSKWADLKHRSKPLETMVGDANTAGDKNCDALVAYTQTLMWIFTDNEQYAQSAMVILNGWSIQKNTEPNSWCLLATPAVFAEAAELLRATYPKWQPEDIAKFSAMLNRVYLPILHNRMVYGGKEFDTIYAMMAIGVFNDDRGAFDEALSHFVSYLPCFIYLKEDGPTPKISNYWLSTPSDAELAKMDASLFPNPADAWFSVKQTDVEDTNLLESADLDRLWSNAMPQAYIDGLCAVMFSTKGGMTQCDGAFVSLSHALEIAWHQGVDLYTPNTKRITSFMELYSHLRLRMDDTIPLAFYGVSPGPMNGTWEVAYNHYHNRKGLDLPWTRELLDKAIRPCITETPVTTAWWTYVHSAPTGLRASQILYPALGNCAWETLTHGELDKH